jgi:hypothetical protein
MQGFYKREIYQKSFHHHRQTSWGGTTFRITPEVGVGVQGMGRGGMMDLRNYVLTYRECRGYKELYLSCIPYPYPLSHG